MVSLAQAILAAGARLILICAGFSVFGYSVMQCTFKTA